jgi:hypothetical protein
VKPVPPLVVVEPLPSLVESFLQDLIPSAEILDDLLLLRAPGLCSSIAHAAAG